MPPREAITGGAAHGDWSTMSNEDCTTTTRGLPWFRLYTTLTRDPRFRRQPLHYRWAWIAVLSIAARCTKRGYLIIDGENITADDLADEAAITTEQASEALDWFRSRLLIVSYRGSLRVDGWDRSQFESDSSTKRVQKHRSKAQSVEQECNVTSNVPESPPDTDTDTDIERPKTLSPNPAKSAELDEEPTPKQADPNAVELATLLHSLMSENFKSRGVSMPKSYRPEKWAADIEKAHRIDGYEWEVIREVIEWSQADEFWSQNILSGGKLRTKMPQLVLKSREPKKEVEW